MNKEVNFEIAKLLKEKGFDEKCSHYYIDDFMNFKHDGVLYKTSLPNDWDNENIFQFVKRTNQHHLCNAPTISEVVMWLYEKNGVWINVDVDINGKFRHIIRNYNSNDRAWEVKKSFSISENYNSPTEAYEAAITYCLENLIQGGNK